MGAMHIICAQRLQSQNLQETLDQLPDILLSKLFMFGGRSSCLATNTVRMSSKEKVYVSEQTISCINIVQFMQVPEVPVE